MDLIGELLHLKFNNLVGVLHGMIDWPKDGLEELQEEVEKWRETHKTSW